MKKEEEKEIDIDESLLTPEQREEMEKERRFPWKWLLFTGIILTLMVVCIIVIVALPK